MGPPAEHRQAMPGPIGAAHTSVDGTTVTSTLILGLYRLRLDFGLISWHFGAHAVESLAVKTVPRPDSSP